MITFSWSNVSSFPFHCWNLLSFFSLNIFSHVKLARFVCLSNDQLLKTSVNKAGARAVTEEFNLGSPFSHIAEFAVERARAWLRVSKGLWTYLFFSYEPFERLSSSILCCQGEPEVGTPSLSLSLTHTVVAVYTGTPGSCPGCSSGNSRKACALYGYFGCWSCSFLLFDP